MVLDTSAIIAILHNEPERRLFNEAIEAAERRLMSTVSFVETSMIIETRYGAEGIRDLDSWLSKASVEFVEVDLDQAHIARRAFRLYGKGRHEAALNFGDCFAYAAAAATGEPLLFKGTDFYKTDIEPHEASSKPEAAPER
jgi:ribonuclease VapC